MKMTFSKDWMLKICGLKVWKVEGKLSQVQVRLFLSLENPHTSVKICLNSRWFVDPFPSDQQWSTLRQGLSKCYTSLTLPKLLLCNCHDACLTASEKARRFNHFGIGSKWIVAKGKEPMAYNSVCRAHASEISDLKFSTAACMARYGEFLASLETQHNSPNPVTSFERCRNKTQEAQPRSQGISGFGVFSFLPWSLPPMMIVVWLLYDSWSYLVMLLEALCEILWMFSTPINFTALSSSCQHLMIFWCSKILKGHVFEDPLASNRVLSSRPRDVGVRNFESEMCWEPKWLSSLSLNKLENTTPTPNRRIRRNSHESIQKFIANDQMKSFHLVLCPSCSCSEPTCQVRLPHMTRRCQKRLFVHC